MNAENNFQHIEHEQSNAVISFNNGTTFRVDKLMKQLNYFFQDSVLNKLSVKLQEMGLGSTPRKVSSSLWNEQGVKAEILEPKSGEWKKGKVRMRVILEFCPDELEEIKDNPSQNNNFLDDIRQTII